MRSTRFLYIDWESAVLSDDESRYRCVPTQKFVLREYIFGLLISDFRYNIKYICRRIKV